MKPACILFYVQHLLGIGHLRRGLTLARGLGAAGYDVHLVSGGKPIPSAEAEGVTLVQLPPVMATDLSFKTLVDATGRTVDEAWRESRRTRLLEILEEVAPDLLLFELFPFGRWGMRFELLPLLEAVAARRPRPLVVSSVRDILVAKSKPERYEQMVDLARTHFDHVLIHGDENVVALYETLPQARAIAERVHHTGYVVDTAGRRGGPGADGWGEVLVSAGGGRVGRALLELAIAARPLTPYADRTWRVLVGYHVDEADFHEIQALAGDDVIVERARTDFPNLLMNCVLSISQGGYNTVMEALRAGCRVVVSPYAGGEESEQTLRAELLAARGALHTVREERLTAEKLAAAVSRAAAAPPPGDVGISTDGVLGSTRLITEWLAREREPNG